MGLVVKNLSANARDAGSIPGSGRYPGVGNGTLLQYSCLRNPMDSGTKWATVHGTTKSWPQLAHTHTHTHTHTHIYHFAACNSPLISHLLCQIGNYNRGASLSPFPHLSVTRFAHMWHFLHYALSGHPHKSEASSKPAVAAFAPRISSWPCGIILEVLKTWEQLKCLNIFL